MSDFDSKYVTTNNRPGAPQYDDAFVNSLKEDMLSEAPDLALIADAVLSSCAIGAHRADFVPRLLDAALQTIHQDIEKSKVCFEQFRAVVMICWPFIGIPWCVPACLGMVNVLEKYNLLSIAYGRAQPPLSDAHIAMGQELQQRTYANVQNSEVQAMLQNCFADFTLTTWGVVFGYSLAETTNRGIFEAHQSQLILAASIASSGATRQARSHMTGALGLGLSVAAAKAILKAAKRLNEWNGVEISDIDAGELNRQMEAAQAAK
ncbi:hypothetical protein P152DRAFT_458395 [Eremomyces bilateralis CBS 781.70]|uniref:Carboxymuconolactone decarboxylase-like domain-containing protein n=1 Tax=Eremomyces bilateralis CBS 781.70 TaxID=1392243 RepID=A0A6G1G3J9_9PEZI|nr:uncharacterized protein P152DRAFT_458395 [Eremomyces bilateralis CBS 781.70]KAF1812562.1 hypothetical protein P152DRAFT_458395 [Eremomyces bilateralis CBS 781.70]